MSNRFVRAIFFFVSILILFLILLWVLLIAAGMLNKGQSTESPVEKQISEQSSGQQFIQAQPEKKPFSFWDILIWIAVVYILFRVLRGIRGFGGGPPVPTKTYSMIPKEDEGENKKDGTGVGTRKIATPKAKKITFDDVGGAWEAKKTLQQIINFLKDPGPYKKIGGRMPKGAILVGPEGTGKTYLARAVAGEANVPFFSMGGSEFIELYVGVGARRVRELFEEARKNAPCIVFIDEIDSIGGRREGGSGGDREYTQTLNQILAEIDGFESYSGVFLLGATNRPELLDPALTRPGRFDRQIVIGRPDRQERREILEKHARGLKISPEVDLDKIAQATPGFAGAHLANLLNEAALNASDRDALCIEAEDIEAAEEMVMLGLKKPLKLTDDIREIISYHECGHVGVAFFSPEADPVHQVTIIPHGKALGLTQQMPEDDQYILTLQYLKTQIAILMGGRVSEEFFLQKETTGASDDLQRATELARRMVCELGMSSARLGHRTFQRQSGGWSRFTEKEYSQELSKQIDEEIKKLIEEGYENAIRIITRYQDVIRKMAQELLAKEILNAGQIAGILNEKPS